MMLEEQAHWGFCARCHRHQELDQDQLCVWCFDRKVNADDNRHDNYRHVWKGRERKKRRTSMQKVGTIFRGKDVGMTGRQYIMVSCPCCPEGENTRLAPYNKGNPLQSTTVRLCGPHRKSRAGSIFNRQSKP